MKRVIRRIVSSLAFAVDPEARLTDCLVGELADSYTGRKLCAMELGMSLCA
jgi:hypothetical protein